MEEIIECIPDLIEIDNSEVLDEDPLKIEIKEEHEDTYPIRANKGVTFMSHRILSNDDLPHDKDDTIRRCKVCNKTYKNTSFWEKHMLKHLSNNTYDCDSCNKKFQSKFNLEIHKPIHLYNEKHYICNFCTKKFLSLKTLSKHMQMHNSKVVFNCKLCSSNFTTAGNLKTHMVTHIPSKQQKHAYKNNRNVENKVKQVKNYCKTCKKCFASAGNLKTHMVTHLKNVL